MTMSIALSKSFRCSGSTHSRRFFSSTANRSVKHWNRCSVSRMGQPYTVTLIGLLFHRFLSLLLGMVSPGSIVAFWIVALIISSATLHFPPPASSWPEENALVRGMADERSRGGHYLLLRNIQSFIDELDASIDRWGFVLARDETCPSGILTPYWVGLFCAFRRVRRSRCRLRQRTESLMVVRCPSAGK